MSTSASTLSITSSSGIYAVPKLTEMNWVEFKTKTMMSLRAQGLARHLDGTVKTPYYLPQDHDKNGQPVTLIADKSRSATETEIEENHVLLDAFAQKEALAIQQLYATIPSSVFIQVQSKDTVAQIWDAICEIYEAKSDLVQADLRSRLQSMKCGEKDDIRTHLTTMMTLHEELTGMGAHVIDRDFMAMVIGSLPTSLHGIIRTTTAAIRASGRIITSDIVIAVVFEEADHIKINNGGNSMTNDTALATSSKSRKQHGKGKSKKPDVKCNNCSRVGHMKDNCWRKGGGKEGQGPHQKKNESASATAATDDYTFLTSTLSDSATVAAVPIEKHGAIVDSGASSHFCPDRNRFTVFTPIPLKPVKIANGQSIFATGKGDMVIELPKGNERSNITLKDTLYVPDIALTLISTTHIVKAGFAINMEEDWCKIRSPKPAHKLVARIPEVNGLYRIVGTECAATATTATSPKTTCLTLMQLHECMGHIAFSTLKTMVSRGMIHGVEIIQSSESEFCDMCIKAKITCLPFPNESKTRAAKYGERIHTDVWGPACVKSLSGKRYYISFMDDYSRETSISFVKKKSEVYQKLMEHIAFIHTQHNATVKFVRSDRSGE